MAAVPTLSAEIPLDGSVIRAILTTPEGKRPVYYTPATLGHLLLSSPGVEADLSDWWDLLGVAGVAAHRRGSEDKIIMTSPAQVRDIRFDSRATDDRQGIKGQMLKMHTPALVWILKFTEKRLISGRLFAAERLLNSVAEEVKLAVFPYAHANNGSGIICWGNVTISHITPGDPRLAERVFFNSTTNHHLFEANWLGASLGDWLRAHQKPEDLATVIPLPWDKVTTTTLGAALGRD